MTARSKLAVAAGLMSALLTAAPAHATSGPGCFLVGNLPPEEPLMLRAGPSVKSEVVGKLFVGKHGVIAENGACRPFGVRPSKQWCPLQVFDGDTVMKGWARLAYLQSSHCP